MKLSTICIFVLVTPLLISCIRENADECKNAVSLSFVYFGDGQDDISGSKIENVQLYLFSDDGQFIEKHEINKNSLDSYRGIVLPLDQGNYHAVCWGNMFSNTEIIDTGTNLSDYLLTHPDYLTESRMKTNDSLYYASQTFYVEGSGSETKTISFVSAHIKFEIYIQGLPRQPQTINESDTTFAIKVGNLFTGYKFDMSIYGNSVSFSPDIVYDTTGQIALAKLNVFRFRNNNPIHILFYKDNMELYRLNLKEFMTTNQIVVEGIEEITIPIYISFKDIGIEISVDEWDYSGVKPIF